MNIQFIHNMTAVRFYGLGADIKAFGDFFNGNSVSQKQKHFPFTPAETGDAVSDFLNILAFFI